MLYFGGGQIPLFSLLAQFPDFSPGDWVAILVAAGGLITAGLTALGTVRRKQFDDLVAIVDTLHETVESLREDNIRLEKKASEAQNKADDTRKRADILLERLKKAQGEIDALREQVAERDEQLEALGAALSAREAEIKHLRRDLNEAVSLRADRLNRIAELESKTTMQEEEIQRLRQQVDVLQKKDTGELKER